MGKKADIYGKKWTLYSRLKPVIMRRKKRIAGNYSQKESSRYFVVVAVIEIASTKRSPRVGRAQSGEWRRRGDRLSDRSREQQQI